MNTLEAINLFINSRRSKGLSPQTIRWYRGILLFFAQRYPTLPESPEDIEAFLVSCKTGDERRHGYYRTLRCLYRFLHRRLNTPNPVEVVDPPRRLPKQPKALMPDDVNKLLNYPHPPQIKAAILFLIDTGARVGELAGLDIDDLEETPWGLVATIKGKTGVRMVPISYETYHALMVNLPFRYKAHWMGTLISRAFNNAGVEGSAHKLRHTFGTLWQGDELVLQQIMGHAHLSTTRLYRHLRTQVLSEQHHQYSPLRMVLASSKSML